MVYNELNEMFNAKSVAILGASNNPNKIGYNILKNLIDSGYKGQIYPINIKEEQVLGLKAYKNVSEISEKIDLIVIIIPSNLVLGALEEASSKGVKNAIIISGGFREIGNDDMENDLVKYAQEKGISFIGPNCQGINYTPNNMCVSWPLIKTRGSMAIIAQSGTVAAAFSMWAEKEEIGISGSVSLGNKSGVSELDIMEFFAEDDNTKVIALNLEGTKEGRRLMEMSKKIVPEKPIVVLKPGRTEKGIKAAQSHTKSIAGSDKVFSAACKQVGIVRADTITEFYDYSKILALLKKPKGKNVLIVTSSGGSGILATDTFEENNIVDVIELNSNLKDILTKELPSHCVVSNPIDLTGDTDALRYKKCVEMTCESDSIDFYLLIFGDPIPGACEVVEELKRETEKPIIVCYLGGGDVEGEEVIKMHRKGIPTFPTPERAAKAASVLCKYGNITTKKPAK